jgi:VWFA-related protein
MKCLALVVSVTAATVLSAQQPSRPGPPDAPPTVLRVGVDLVRVDATVIDRRGRHVTDLTASDFEVSQDGKPQTISSFAYVSTGSAPAAAGDSTAAVPRAVSGSTYGASARPSPEQIHRTMAIIVDDLGLSFESTYRVHETLRRFIERNVQPGDLVAILRTGAGVGALQQFTTDLRLMYAAAERVRWNMRSRVSPFQMTSSLDDKRVDAREAELFTAGTLGAIAYVLRGVAELPGRKSLVIFSDGYHLNEPL